MSSREITHKEEKKICEYLGMYVYVLETYEKNASEVSSWTIVNVYSSRAKAMSKASEFDCDFSITTWFVK